MTTEKATHSGAEKPLSILIISPNPKVHGGVSTFIETMKSHLTGCHVTSYWVGTLNDEKESLLARIYRLFTAPVAIAWLSVWQKFDVIHINPSFNSKSLVRDGLVLFLLRVVNCQRVLVYFHGWQNNIEIRIRKNPVLRFLTVWLLNGAARITVLGPDFKKGLEGLGVDSRKIICTRTMFNGAGLAASKDRGASLGRRTILFMSRFDREKGVYELLSAFARLAHEFPDVDLIMAGDGKEKARLLAEVASLGLGARVAFPGYVTGRDKAEMLSSCTFYALPTYYPEGMPVALLEAMAVGKPLLTSPAGSIGTIVSDPENGVVLPSVTAEAVEAGLRKLLTDPQLCEDIGRRNAAYAWQKFEAKVVTADIKAIYSEIDQR